MLLVAKRRGPELLPKFSKPDARQHLAEARPDGPVVALKALAASR